MSKTKQRSHSELEYLRGLVKELEKENRSLRKQLKTLEKKEHFFDDKSLNQEEELANDTEETFPQKRKLPCHECGKGFYEEFHLMEKTFGTCNICEHRKRLN